MMYNFRYGIALSILLLIGCGGPSDAPTLAPVTGTVTFKGAPLEQGMVVFHPAKGRSAHGTIKNGQITDVTTLVKGDGAPLGDLKVTIISNKPDPEDKSGMSMISLIPDKYGDIEKSGLSCTVQSGSENTVSFELKE